MPDDKIADTISEPHEAWVPTHHVIACRGILIPVRVTSIDNDLVTYEDKWGSNDTCHIRDIFEEGVK